MQWSLRKNICRLDSYGTRRKKVDVDRINEYLPTDVQYSCRYWVKHLIQTQSSVDGLDMALQFLREHFLHWFEAMAILGHVSDVVTTINTLQSIVQVMFSR